LTRLKNQIGSLGCAEHFEWNVMANSQVRDRIGVRTAVRRVLREAPVNRPG
jgi:hypothetical protein